MLVKVVCIFFLICFLWCFSFFIFICKVCLCCFNWFKVFGIKFFIVLVWVIIFCCNLVLIFCKVVIFFFKFCCCCSWLIIIVVNFFLFLLIGVVVEFLVKLEEFVERVLILIFLFKLVVLGIIWFKLFEFIEVFVNGFFGFFGCILFGYIMKKNIKNLYYWKRKNFYS